MIINYSVIFNNPPNFIIAANFIMVFTITIIIFNFIIIIIIAVFAVIIAYFIMS